MAEIGDKKHIWDDIVLESVDGTEIIKNSGLSGSFLSDNRDSGACQLLVLEQKWHSFHDCCCGRS